jgi:hypothetical protein
LRLDVRLTLPHHLPHNPLTVGPSPLVLFDLPASRRSPNQTNKQTHTKSEIALTAQKQPNTTPLKYDFDLPTSKLFERFFSSPPHFQISKKQRIL